MNESRDSLHSLPLAMIPLSTPGLQRARLVKNARLETVVELYSDEITGSGHYSTDKLADVFPSYINELDQDRPKLDALSTLDSFDVFSLRIGLRKLELGVTDGSYLKLSDKLRGKLAKQLPEYSRPLLYAIYGEGNADETLAFSNPLAKLTQEETDIARRNVIGLAKKLEIPPANFTNFVEEYGDLAMALCYYRYTFNHTAKDVMSFKDWARELKTHPSLGQDEDLMRIYRSTEGTLDYLHRSLNARFAVFDKQFETFWGDVSSETWTALKLLLTSNYSNIGGVLCGLRVKMDLWQERFPSGEGNPNQRADFLKSEIVPGLSKLFELESAAPKIIH